MQIVAVGEDDSVQGCVALGWLGCGSLPEPLDLQEQIPVENVFHTDSLLAPRGSPWHSDRRLLPRTLSRGLRTLAKQ